MPFTDTVVFNIHASWLELKCWTQACGKCWAVKSVGMACLSQAYIMIHHVRNNSSLQRFGVLQTMFYCCERGQTCWQTREGAPGGFFCLVQFLILSHILCFRKQYHVLTLSQWSGNTGLSSHCTARAQKCSDHHCLCYPPLCCVFSLVSKCVFLGFC